MEEIEQIKSYIKLLESNGEYLCAEVFKNELEEIERGLESEKNRIVERNGI